MRLKWIAKKIGVERIILKKNNMTSYFPEDPESIYYNSNEFQKILNYLKKNPESCTMIERKEKLSIRIKNIFTVKEALKVFKEILE